MDSWISSGVESFKCWRGLLLALVLLPALAQAEPARVDGMRVWLPVVDDYPDTHSYELRLVPRTQPQQLVLEQRAAATGPVTATAAWYEGDLLYVPEVWIGGLSYWADLRETAPGRFVLLDFGRNRQLEIPAGVYQHQYWEEIPGEATDIGVGPDGSVWAVGASHYGYDYGLYYWSGDGWYEQRGSAVRVDVDPRGRPWIVNDNHEIWRLDRGRWERIAGAAHDIGIGADGSVWVIGVSERSSGYGIYRLGRYGWIEHAGSGVRIDVGPDGMPWVINDEDRIFRLEGSQWRRIPGSARDIGIGADGSVWVIGADERAGGYGVYRYNGSGWTKIPGSGRQISVGPDGAPWVVNRDGYIYRGWGYQVRR